MNATPAPRHRLDILIVNGMVFDGSSNPPRAVDVGIRSDRLVMGENLAGLAAQTVIDAAGRYVCPGFIDIHTHSDFNRMLYPNAESKILAGVTTEVTGNCGCGPFPLIGEALARRKAEYEPLGLTVDWATPADYFALAAAQPCSVNHIALLGHGNVRSAVLGYADVRADAGHIRQMVRFAEEAFQAGAWGLSSGLVYAPGVFADRDELIALARVAADHGGCYASHIRNESGRVLEATSEFLDIVAASGAHGPDRKSVV